MFVRFLIALSLVSVLPACGSGGDSVESKTIAGKKAEALKTSALRDAKATSHATLKGDWKTVIHHTHPNVVAVMGGPEAAAELVGSMMTEMSDIMSIEQSKIGEVSEIVYEQGQYRCFVENYLTVKAGGLITKKLSYLFGVYDTEKGIWHFLEAEQLKDGLTRELVLSDFKTALKVPADKTL